MSELWQNIYTKCTYEAQRKDSQWSGSNKIISRILILNVFDYQFANCLRPNLTFIWGLVGYLEVSKILLAKQVEKKSY